MQGAVYWNSIQSGENEDMAFLPKYHLNADDLKQFHSTGIAFGAVPVYIGGELDEGSQPEIAVRNWYPEWALDVFEMMWITGVQMGAWDEDDANIPMRRTGGIS